MVPSETLVDATKRFPGEPHVLSNGKYANGHVNGFHDKINGAGSHSEQPRINSCDAVFGPRNPANPKYEMLPQALGTRRPLKVIYLGGGASGQPL
jgi:hypothetical protein